MLHVLQNVPATLEHLRLRSVEEEELVGSLISALRRFERLRRLDLNVLWEAQDNGGIAQVLAAVPSLRELLLPDWMFQPDFKLAGRHAALEIIKAEMPSRQYLCGRRCTVGGCQFREPRSQHYIIRRIFDAARDDPPRFPSLRCIKLWGCDHISFATRVGRDQVRLGAMAPDLRAVGITLCDEADLPWIEEWDDE